jgi:hypothetical protein
MLYVRARFHWGAVPFAIAEIMAFALILDEVRFKIAGVLECWAREA